MYCNQLMMNTRKQEIYHLTVYNSMEIKTKYYNQKIVQL